MVPKSQYVAKYAAKHLFLCYFCFLGRSNAVLVKYSSITFNWHWQPGERLWYSRKDLYIPTPSANDGGFRVQSLGPQLTRQVFQQKNRNLPIVEVLCESFGLPREYILNLASVDFWIVIPALVDIFNCSIQKWPTRPKLIILLNILQTSPLKIEKYPFENIS